MVTKNDKLNFANDAEIKKLIDPDGISLIFTLKIEKVLLSCIVVKYNPIGWKQERNMVVTNRSILNLKKKGKFIIHYAKRS